MYSGPMCNFCEAAKSLLIRNNLEFKEIDISILSNYKLWPTNYFSVSELAKENKEYKHLVEENINSEEASKFMLRFINIERLVLNKILNEPRKRERFRLLIFFDFTGNFSTILTL
mgnify:CR=1 FL=1